MVRALSRKSDYWKAEDQVAGLSGKNDRGKTGPGTTDIGAEVCVPYIKVPQRPRMGANSGGKQIGGQNIRFADTLRVAGTLSGVDGRGKNTC